MNDRYIQIDNMVLNDNLNAVKIFFDKKKGVFHSYIDSIHENEFKWHAAGKGLVRYLYCKNQIIDVINSKENLNVWGGIKELE